MPDAMELDHLGAIAVVEPSPEKSVIARQDSKRLQQAILKVPPPHRLVLVLHDGGMQTCEAFLASLRNTIEQTHSRCGTSY